ncbi:hypothetical protein HY496_03070 [Candidatus Woesearchaeota archaeon]|nr:hypothetical protein [Candidatus Woesearchaeota archaeon]
MKKWVMMWIVFTLVAGAVEIGAQQSESIAPLNASFGAGGVACNSLEDCQAKVNEKDPDKRITYGQAADALNQIAEEKKQKYDTAIKDVDKNNLNLDGTIKSGLTSQQLISIQNSLGLPYAPTQDIKGVQDVKVGDVLQYVGSQKEGFPGVVKVKGFDNQVQEGGATVSVIVFEESGPQGKNLAVKVEEVASKFKKPESDEQLLARINEEITSQESVEKVATSFGQKSLWTDQFREVDWVQSVGSIGKILGSGVQAFASIGSYRAFSNLLFPEITKEWSEWANTELTQRWASLPNFFSEELCTDDNTKRANQPGQSAAFITTSAGTHQFVGAVSAERSPTKFPILCSKNKEDEWTCPGTSVCKDDTYCYKDKASEKPEEGYFYKITWGVSAPADEKFTPYLDENGVAAKFNVYLDETPLFKRKGILDPREVIQLQNGGRDGGMILRYSPVEYQRVCIHFAKPIKDRQGDDVPNICVSIKPSQGGVVEYASSSKTEPIASSSEEVEITI